jgi:hypothetical protein
MPIAAPLTMPINTAIDLTQKQPSTAKPNMTTTEVPHPSTHQGQDSEDDIWNQLEPIYSWVGI